MLGTARRVSTNDRDGPTTASHVPILDRRLDDIIVAPDGFEHPPLNVGDFLGRAIRLAEQLPAADHAVNICNNRYQFLLAFCAVIIRGQCNLLPPNRHLGKQQELLDDYPDSYIIHDGSDVLDTAASINTRKLDLAGDACIEVPLVALKQLAAISFTSGSTGKSSPNIKYWSTLFHGGKINAVHMLEEPEVLHSVLATVPAQHMYGLETSIMLALFARLCVDQSQPLYPADIRDRLQAMPSPRMLISTPVHLRAMIQSGLSFPAVELVISATAPLDAELATQVEQCFSGRLGEIYGCTEVGSIAWRYPTRTLAWSAFSAFGFDSNEHRTLLHGEHIEQPIELQDVIEFEADGSFHLRGRSSDMLNIAGKRGSLAELNQIIANTQGVEDCAVFCLPEVDRPVALAVAPDLNERQIVADLRRLVDAVFVPRPVIKVDGLPRSETGKLERQKLLDLYQQFVKKK
jgi:acyl-coenzyme A synthetase/AMP-(fatty) acid ligase